LIGSLAKIARVNGQAAMLALGSSIDAQTPGRAARCTTRSIATSSKTRVARAKSARSIS